MSVVALAPPAIPPLQDKAEKCPVQDCGFEGLARNVKMHYEKWHVGVTKHRYMCATKWLFLLSLPKFSVPFFP